MRIHKIFYLWVLIVVFIAVAGILFTTNYSKAPSSSPQVITNGRQQSTDSASEEVDLEDSDIDFEEDIEDFDADLDGLEDFDEEDLDVEGIDDNIF